MLCLSTASLRYLLKPLSVAADETDETLRAHSVSIVGALVEEEGTIDHFVSLVPQDAHDRVKHGACNLLQRLLRPAFIPHNYALVEEGGVLGAIARKVRMLVVQRNHNIQILLYAANEEFKERSALILVSHLILQL